MLSDEEKKALKELTEIKELVEEDLKYKDYEVAATLDQIDLESLVIVLNLIEKQSKEIEEAEQKEKKAYIDGTNVAHELCNKMWKNKIKAKIDEVDKDENASIPDFIEYAKEYATQKLQELLEKE